MPDRRPLSLPGGVRIAVFLRPFILLLQPRHPVLVIRPTVTGGDIVRLLMSGVQGPSPSEPLGTHGRGTPTRATPDECAGSRR